MNRPVIFALHVVGAASAVVGIGIILVETDCGIVILNRPVIFALVIVGVPSVDVVSWVIRMAIDSGTEILNRPVIFTLVVIGPCSDSIGVRVWTDRDGLVCVLNCPVVFPQRIVDLCTIAIRHRNSDSD